MKDSIESNKLGIDDVALNSTYFRLERMNDKSIWVASYNNEDGNRTTFSIDSKSPITVTLIEDHEKI